MSEEPTASSHGRVKLPRAVIEWTDDEYESAIDAPAVILPNGWVYTPETDDYHPPHAIDRIGTVDAEDSEHQASNTGPESWGRNTCEECGADLNPPPAWMGTVECPDCGHDNEVVT